MCWISIERARSALQRQLIMTPKWEPISGHSCIQLIERNVNFSLLFPMPSARLTFNFEFTFLITSFHSLARSWNEDRRLWRKRSIIFKILLWFCVVYRYTCRIERSFSWSNYAFVCWPFRVWKSAVDDEEVFNWHGNCFLETLKQINH